MKISGSMLDPHAAPSTSIKSLIESLWKNRLLILQMAKRDVIGRYKGSILGLAWSYFNPIFMLVVYTFVFSEVFKSRWGGGDDDNKTQFAIVLFVGMIILGLFSEIINRAPNLIHAHSNYVKKVIFPLEILSFISVGSALFHAFISLCVLLFAYLIFNGYVNWTVLIAPLVILPLVIFSLGLSFFLSSLGVYLRDVSPIVGLITTVLMFISPVFYPMSAVPERFQLFIMINPLTFIIEQSRDVIIWGNLPNIKWLVVYWVFSILACWSGYYFFQKTRSGFADVL